MPSFTIQMRIFSPSGFCNINCRGEARKDRKERCPYPGNDGEEFMYLTPDLSDTELKGAVLFMADCGRCKFLRAQIYREHRGRR